MTVLYQDTSALVKRYLVEVGSTWIRGLNFPSAGNIIIISDLTAVEFFSTLGRRQREGTLTPTAALVLQNSFLIHSEREYLSVSLEKAVLDQARLLITRYPLRSLDAIQLASAIEAANLLREAITFVSGDNNLLNAAASEGFLTDNPNLHT